MFMHAIQSNNNASPKHHHRREWHKYNQQNVPKSEEMAIIEAILGAGENANENGIGNEKLKRTTTKMIDNNEASALGQRMRVNTGQWAWSEAHSVREEVK